MGRLLLGLAVVGLAAAIAAEPLVRRLVARRVVLLLGRVVHAPEGAEAVLPPGRLLPGLLRGRLAWAAVTAPTLIVGDLRVHQVDVRLADVVVDRRLRVTAGSGVLEGHVPGPDVRRLAGAPDRVRLEGGRAAINLPGMSIRLRPLVAGDRIRLAPTPFSMRVPPLPDGASLVWVGTADDTLLVRVDLELPRLLTGPGTG